jgi:VWFA-related protein
MRRLAAPLLSIAAALPLLAQQPAPVQEKIVVERILVDARVVTGTGDPVTGLGISDFHVLIDGKPAVVESVDWIPDTAAERELADLDHPRVEVNRSLDIPAPRGRLLVYFFQTDIAREASRLGGQMQMNQQLDGLLNILEAEDRVAVLSFDSHLKLRSDFTDDKHRLHAAMEEAMLMNEPNPVPIVPSPSIATRLDRKEMMQCAKAETALILIANALRPIPGPKSMVFIGWGLGRMSQGGWRMESNYPFARAALEAARVSVFTLDVTQADSHTLEVGLGVVSGDTGGSYDKTFHFPKLAIERLKKTLTGHYELEVRKPDTKVRGRHSIEVTTTRRNADVLARSSYVDKE